MEQWMRVTLMITNKEQGSYDAKEIVLRKHYRLHISRSEGYKIRNVYDKPLRALLNNCASRHGMFSLKLFVNNFIQGVIQLLFVHESNFHLDIEIYVRNICKP